MKTRRFQVDLFNPKRSPERYFTYVSVADPYDIKVRTEAAAAGVFIEKITPVDAKKKLPGAEDMRLEGLVDVVVFDTGTPKINVSMVNYSGDNWCMRVSDGTGNFTTLPADGRGCTEMSARFVADLIKKMMGKKARR